MRPHSNGTDSYFTVMESVLYDCAPYLNRRGAHVWVDEVSRERFVVGFTCWAASERGALWDWLHERLRQAVTGRVYTGVSVKDVSASQPSKSVSRTSPVTA